MPLNQEVAHLDVDKKCNRPSGQLATTLKPLPPPKWQCINTQSSFQKRGISFQQPPFQNWLTTVEHCHLDKKGTSNQRRPLRNNLCIYNQTFTLLWWLQIWTMGINTLFSQKQIISRLQVYLLVWIFRVYNHLSMDPSMDKSYFQWNHPSQSMCKTPIHTVYP